MAGLMVRATIYYIIDIRYFVEILGHQSSTEKQVIIFGGQSGQLMSMPPKMSLSTKQ